MPLDSPPVNEFHLPVLSTLAMHGVQVKIEIHVFHLHVILFLFIVGFIYFWMYCLSDISPIHTFLSAVLVPKQNIWEIGNIILLCKSCTQIWSICLYFFTRVPSVLTNNESDIFGGCITIGWFFIQACNSLNIFSLKILSSCIFGKIDVLLSGRYDFNMRRCCLSQFILLYIALIEQANNIDDDFT